MDISTVLDDCLERLHSGEAMESCLQRYPHHEGELRPMLVAAARLLDLSAQRLSEPQKARGRFMIREALAKQSKSPEQQSWLGYLGRIPGVALAAMLALVLLVAVTATTVAASLPGDPGYGVRVWAERLPAHLTWSPAGRAWAELRFADHRLQDLADYLAETGQLANVALAAYMEGMEAAASTVERLTEHEREQVAVRLTAQSRQLTQLMAQTPGAQASYQLQLAARWTHRVAERVRAGQPPEGEWPRVNPLPPQFGEPQGPQPGPGPQAPPPAGVLPRLSPTRPLRPVVTPPDVTPPAGEAPGPGPRTPDASPASPGQDMPPAGEKARPSDVPGWAPEGPTPPGSTSPATPGPGQTPAGPQPGQTGDASQGTPQARPTRGPSETAGPGPTTAPGPSEAPGPTQPGQPPQPPGPARTPSPPAPGRS